MVKPITKLAITISKPSDVSRCLEEAIWTMKHGRSGPVWLDVPLDVQAAHIEPSNLVGFSPPVI
jgi:acetolactate synthase-1/2/3 large subunit